MKVKVINRNEEQFTRERSGDVRKVHRNLDPALHPFEKAREYTRALNAAKLDRVFARPFLAQYAHDDGVTCLARNPTRLNSILTGAADGILSLWDIPGKRCLRRFEGHTSAVRAAAFASRGDLCVSVSTDCTAKLWRIPYAPFEAGPGVMAVEEAAAEYQGKGVFVGVDHHWERNIFATAGNKVEVWDHESSEPLESFAWGADTVTSVRFNPAEPELFVTTGSDRGIALYDLRLSTPIRKLIMQTKSNACAWNPIEAFNFTVANEDCNLYSYDMRNLRVAKCVHQDFVSAVMDVDFSPTGREFVAGSYDRTVRIFGYTAGHSREVYHAKRMHRVFAVRYSGDGTYVFSGSDDMNMRVWKANASEQLGQLLPREMHKHAYNQALIQRYKHLPEVKRIVRHRQLPGAVYKASKLRRSMIDNEAAKTKRRMANSKPGTIVVKPERKRKVVAEIE